MESTTLYHPLIALEKQGVTEKRALWEAACRRQGPAVALANITFLIKLFPKYERKQHITFTAPFGGGGGCCHKGEDGAKITFVIWL